RVEHDGVHVAVKALVEQPPGLTTVGALDQVAHLEGGIDGIWSLGVDHDVAHVGLDGRPGVRDRGDEGVVPDGLDAKPALAKVIADKQIDRLTADVEAARMLWVHRDTANLARAAPFAAVRLHPGLAEILA